MLYGTLRLPSICFGLNMVISPICHSFSVLGALTYPAVSSR